MHIFDICSGNSRLLRHCKNNDDDGFYKSKQTNQQSLSKINTKANIYTHTHTHSHTFKQYKLYTLKL